MDNINYFINACKSGAYKKRSWVFTVFSSVGDLPSVKDDAHFPYRLYKIEDKYFGYYTSDHDSNADPDEISYVLLNGKPIDFTIGEKIVEIDEIIDIYPGDIPNCKEPVETTPGRLFLNWYCFVYGAGDIITYVNDDKVNIMKIASLYGKDAKDDPSDPSKREPGVLYISDLKRMLRAMASFSSFSPICSRSATYYTLTPSDDVAKLKEELLKKHKDELHDPVIVASIEKQLADKDKEYIAQDPDGGYLENSSKGMAGRFKLMIMQGQQNRMDPNKPPVLVTTSLSEPTDPDKIPALIDELRSGSFSRGAMTALGGEVVKFIYRIYSAVEIIKEDCGSKTGIRRELNENNIERYIGHYVITDKGHVAIDEVNKSSLIGKTVTMRSPAYCQADPEGRGKCNICMGDFLRGYEKSMATYCAQVGSQMNARFMKAMHNSKASSKRIDLEKALT